MFNVLNRLGKGKSLIKRRIKNKKETHYCKNIQKVILVQNKIRFFIIRKRLLYKNKNKQAIKIQKCYINFKKNQNILKSRNIILRFIKNYISFRNQKIVRFRENYYAGMIQIIIRRWIHFLKCEASDMIKRFLYSIWERRQLASIKITSFMKMIIHRIKFRMHKIKLQCASRLIQQRFRIYMMNRDMEIQNNTDTNPNILHSGRLLDEYINTRMANFQNNNNARLNNTNTQNNREINTRQNVHQRLYENNLPIHNTINTQQQNQINLNTHINEDLNLQRNRVDQFIRERNQRRIQRDAQMDDIRNRLNNLHNRFIAGRNTETVRPNIINNVVIPPLRPLPHQINNQNLTLDNHPQPENNREETYQERYLRQQEERLNREFQNPRVRELYNNNQIYLGGRRVLVGQNNQVVYGENAPENNRDNYNSVQYLYNGDTRKFNCPICMDDVYIGTSVTLECGHQYCNNCIRDSIISAIGNISTEIPLKCPMFHNGCNSIITIDTSGVKQLLSNEISVKFEKYTLLKMHISAENLRYCPMVQCQMPYEYCGPKFEEAPQLYSSLNETTCLNCNTVICTYCNDFAHVGISCKLQQERNTGDNQNNETNKYLSMYCKKCPRCNTQVQKLKTREQEEYELRTGLAGGTQECHHMECSNCRAEFCWTCMKIYNNTRYYHAECPTSDCIIRFVNEYPIITHLPIGVIEYIKIIIYNKNNDIIKERYYNILNNQSILGNVNCHPNKLATLHCSDEGVVNRLNIKAGDCTFRQENRGVFVLN